MTRLALFLVAVVAVAALGCSKPTEEDCRKAIDNMQRLMGTDNLREADRIESEVRRCKGGSKKKAVDCAINAQTLDDLRKCDFYKVPENAKGIGTQADDATGSGAVPPTGSSAGSAGTGSAP